MIPNLCFSPVVGSPFAMVIFMVLVIIRMKVLAEKRKELAQMIIHCYALLGKEVIRMPRRDSKGPPTGAKGLQDGRGSGKGKGRAPGKGVGRRKGGTKGPCKQSSAHCEAQPLPVHTKG